MLNVIQLSPCIVDIRATAHDHCYVLDDPLTILDDELVSEGVRLSVPDQTLHVILRIQFVVVSVVESDSTIDCEFPEADPATQLIEHVFEDGRGQEYAEEPE